MKRYIYCMAIIAMMLCACNNTSENKVQDTPLEDQTTDQLKKEEQTTSADTAGIGTNEQPNNVVVSTISNADWDKKIIKTASIQLQLDDYKKFNTLVHNSLKQYGAYVAGEKQSETDYRIENSLTIKVPVAMFDELINSFAGDGVKVVEKDISSDDVTTQVVDTKARMQAKMAVRDKYLELLKQAKNMNEILQVQNEVNSIQEDIEAANGRINYLQHASAYSTIDLSYYQYINGTTSNDEEPGFFTKLVKAFVRGGSVLGEFLLFAISIWPFFLAVFALWLFVKKYKIKRA